MSPKVNKTQTVSEAPAKGKRQWEMPDVEAIRATKAKKNGGMTEEKLLAKYPHVIAGTLQFDREHNKNSVEAKLACGHVARVFTSDLFQVKACPDCRKAKTKEKLAALKSKVAEKTAPAPAPKTKKETVVKAKQAPPAPAVKAPVAKGEVKKAIGRLLK